jgi:hypothetical protein
MNIRCFKIEWLIPLLGIGLIASFLVAANAYRGLERQVNAEGDFLLTLDRLRHDHTLSLALRSLQEGEVDKAAHRLDLLLCWDILRADAELASADSRTRVWVDNVLRRIARVWPKTVEVSAATLPPDTSGIRADAERVLERVLAADPPSEHTE